MNHPPKPLGRHPRPTLLALSLGFLLGLSGCLCAMVAGGVAEEMEHESVDARCSNGAKGEFSDDWCTSSADCEDVRGMISDCRDGSCLYCEAGEPEA